jgi:uncharacterized protein (TIGR02996 family)
MDRLSEHESFLRAIFDAPADDTPRLVYADFLDENGEPERAEFIRVQCEHKRLLSLEPGDPGLGRLHALLPRQVELQRRLAVTHPRLYRAFTVYDRGFLPAAQEILLGTEELTDPEALRRIVAAERPHWFGARALRINRGRPLQPEQVEAMFSLPVVQQITDWNLGGHVEEISADPETGDAGTFALIDMDVHPVITVAGVEALARHRGARRITSLVLTDNNLDNDAARALIRSPYLVNLKRLEFRQGNNLRGRTWQQLLERFGEGVVG